MPKQMVSFGSELFSENFDHQSRKQWKLEYPGKQLQTVDHLQHFINKRVQALEAADSAKKEKPGNQNTRLVRNLEKNNKFPR